MTQKELIQEKNRLELSIKQIETTIAEKTKKGETDVSPLYERINKLDAELKMVNNQLYHHSNTNTANNSENDKKAASIIAGSSVEIRPSQIIRTNNMPDQTKEKKKKTVDCPEIKEIKTAKHQASSATAQTSNT